MTKQRQKVERRPCRSEIFACPHCFLDCRCVHRQKAASETSVIKRQFQNKTGETQCVCLVQQISLFLKHRMLKISMTFTVASEGSVCFGRPKVACSHSSFEKWRLYPKRVSKIHHLQQYIICNVSPLPQGVTSLIMFNRIQNVASEDDQGNSNYSLT